MQRTDFYFETGGEKESVDTPQQRRTIVSYFSGWLDANYEINLIFKFYTIENIFPVNTQVHSLGKLQWTFLSPMIFHSQDCWTHKLAIHPMHPSVLSRHHQGHSPLGGREAGKEGCCPLWDKAEPSLEQGEHTAEEAQAAAREASSAGRAATDDHGWELHVAQAKFLSWQQLLVETEADLKRAPFYGPYDNNCECWDVITHVSELQSSDLPLPFDPFSQMGKGRIFQQNKPHPQLL